MCTVPLDGHILLLTHLHEWWLSPFIISWATVHGTVYRGLQVGWGIACITILSHLSTVISQRNSSIICAFVFAFLFFILVTTILIIMVVSHFLYHRASTHPSRILPSKYDASYLIPQYMSKRTGPTQLLTRHTCVPLVCYYANKNEINVIILSILLALSSGYSIVIHLCKVYCSAWLGALFRNVKLYNNQLTFTSRA